MSQSHGGRETVQGRGIPTQFIILALVAVFVVPGIFFAWLLLNRYADSETARYEFEGLSVARAAAAVLDRHLGGLQTTLQALATSDFLENEDLEAFHRQAARLTGFLGADVGLRTLDGQQVVNTRRPWGAPLPRVAFAIDAEAIASGRPVVTDVFTGAVANRPLVAVILAVSIRGQPKYLLHISAETERIHEAIRNVAGPDWLIGVGDRTGTYVTRSVDHDRFTGTPGVPAFLARASGREGTFVGHSAFGDTVLVGYTRSALSDWLVAASIKETVLDTPLRHALYLLYGFGALTLLAMSCVALWLWRFVARPLEGLAVASRHLGARETPPPIRTGLREFAAVRDALAAAAGQVQANNAQLEGKVAERTGELAAANEALRAQMAAREKVEDQLRQAQKMEAVGQLTGGIAHDFNNLLTIVMGSFERIRRDLAHGRAPADIEQSIDNGIQGAQRAAVLTRSLLAFSRRQPLEPHPVDINRLVSRLSDLLRRTIGEQITIESVVSGGLWRTYVDPNQLESAILNLAVNARDAMPTGGKLTIETANAYLDEHSLAGESDAAPGQYVMVCITDTGTGMTPDVRSKAFEPFFTTKGVGQGTGLGLSQVYGFVKQSGGHIRIYSEAGEGTSVKIYLPRLADDTAAPEPVLRPQATVGPAHGERILVVEDEDGVRERSVEILAELGYRVIEAATGTAGLALLESGAVVDLLFTDVGLPGNMNGRQLANAAQARQPDLKVLFTTGYARNAIVHDGRLDPGVSLITKPFTAAELARAVRGVLDARPQKPTILVVEDDVLIRMGTVAMLEDLGFVVEEAGTAAEAFDKLRRLDGRVAATVLDLGLPDRSGDSLAGEIRAIDPGAPIVIASGYVTDALSRRFAGDARTRFVGKPFQQVQLVEAFAALGIRAPNGRT